MTLVELMVAMAVSMLLMLAIIGALTMTDASRRRAQGVNDINQAGTYAELAIDKLIRNAGSGFASVADYGYGCRLTAAKAGTQILPRPGGTALPAPFNNVLAGSAGEFRLAPVLIAPGQTSPGASGQPSDVLIVMSGNSGHAEAPTSFTGQAGANALTLSSTQGFGASDVLLLVDQQLSATGVADCLVQQVSSAFTSPSTTPGSATLPLAGSYYAESVGGVALTGLPVDADAVNLGNIDSGNPPSFLLIGIGEHNTLYSYDLLQTSATPLQAMADGVFELHARYGLDSDGDGRIDAWATPSGDYAIDVLSSGTTAAASRLRSIKAIRLGLIMRTTQIDSSSAGKATLTLFGDLGEALIHRRTLDDTEQRYRYRTIESTIPIRNHLLINPTS